jgi:hypothetical protein
VPQDGLAGSGETIHQGRASPIDVDGTATATTRDARELGWWREPVERATHGRAVHGATRDAIHPPSEVTATEETRPERRQSFGDPYPPRTGDRPGRSIIVDLRNPRHQLARHVAASSKICSASFREDRCRARSMRRCRLTSTVVK